jgi:LysM repeat protein
MTLTGAVEAATSGGILIDGLLIRTDDSRNLTGNIIEVDVISTAEGALVARAIRLRGDTANAPLVTEPATESPVPSSTPLPTDTLMPPASHTPAPTQRPTSTQQPTRQPTSQRPTASSTPARVDRGGDCETPPTGWVRYTVQGGDTLSDLSAHSGGSLDSVASANCLSDVRHIVVGETIFLPRLPAQQSPTMTDVVDQQRTPVREATATPIPQHDGGEDPQRDREQQREGDSNTSEGGDQAGRTRSR